MSFSELIAWETQVKKENPDFNLDELSKRERARQMVIHELINVHHNACIKINFLINIFKPTIIRESKLKEAQLGVSSNVLFGSDSYIGRTFFRTFDKSAFLENIS